MSHQAMNNELAAPMHQRRQEAGLQDLRDAALELFVKTLFYEEEVIHPAMDPKSLRAARPTARRSA
jgi:hypothetical protein